MEDGGIRGSGHDLRAGLNHIASACARVGDLDSALSVLDKLKERGWHPDPSTLDDLLWSPATWQSHPPVPCRKEGVAEKFKGWRGRGKRVSCKPDWIHAWQSSQMDAEGKALQEGGDFVSAGRWENLPDELLVRVLGILKDTQFVLLAAQVCKSWRAAIEGSVTELSFAWHRSLHLPRLLQILVPRFSSLQSLSLSRCSGLDDQTIGVIATQCTALQSLDLSLGLQLTSASLHALAINCNQLQSVDLSGCALLTEAGLRDLARGCPDLRALNLCGCERAVSNSTLAAFARKCPALQSLNVGWCEQVSDSGVKALADGCPSLQVLDLCGCHLITDEAVEALARNCLQLRVLGLHCCRSISDLSMYHLAASADARRRLNRCWSLISLNVSGCALLHAEAVQAVCDAFPGLHTCPRQRSLNTSGCLALVRVRCQCLTESEAGGAHPESSAGQNCNLQPRNRPL